MTPVPRATDFTLSKTFETAQWKSCPTFFANFCYEIVCETLHNYNIILLTFYSFLLLFSRTPVSLNNVQRSPSQRFSGKFDQRSQISIPVRKLDFDYQFISSEEIKSLEHIRTNINQGQKVTKKNLLPLDMSEY